MLKVKIILRSDFYDFMFIFMLMIILVLFNCFVNDVVLVVVCSLNNFLLLVIEFLFSIYCIRKLNEYIFFFKYLFRNN